MGAHSSTSTAATGGSLPDGAFEIHPIIGPERTDLTLADGVTLVADIWRPDSPGRFPVLLMRQPYGRTIASTVVFAHPAWYAAHGYVVIIQDVRGCGDSGGDFDALVHESADGAATLNWAAKLPFANGKLGTYGFSYQGATQYLALAGGGRRPDAMAPVMAPWSVRDDWAYENNAFRRALNIGWAAQMAWLKATRVGDTTLAAELKRDADPTRLETLLMGRPDVSHLSRWVADDPAYWAETSPSTRLAGRCLDVPVLHVGGWCDYMLSGTLAADAAFRAESPETSHLVIGPWAHLPWNRTAGTVDMGPAAERSIDRLQLRFFDFYLRGRGEPPPAVELFDVGRRDWIALPEPPRTSQSNLYLSSSGLAATLANDGRLLPEPAASGPDRFVHDPSNPAPLLGGALGTPAGFVDRARVDDRGDVAVYTSAHYTEDFWIGGDARLELELEASALPFDLCATLSLITPSGEVMVLRTAYSR